MKLRGELGLFLAGLALVSIGAALMVFSPNSAVKTQAADNYSLIWTAQKVMAVKGIFAQNSGTQDTGPTAIGVSKWQVKGTVGGRSFTEDWTTGDFNDFAMQIPGSSNPFEPGARHNRGCNNATGAQPFDQTKWLTGCWAEQSGIGNAYEHASSFTITEISPADANGRKARMNEGSAIQDTTSCITNPGDGSATSCVITTGAYGFLYLYNLTPRAGGMLMPLEWKVTGTIE